MYLTPCLPYLLIDARREARKAFLAFSSDDAKAQLAESESESVQGNLKSFTEQPANDDVQSYQSTPVRNLSMVFVFLILSLNSYIDQIA
jgi:hypothetical protein